MKGTIVPTKKNKDLLGETAEAILKRIKVLAPNAGNSEQVHHLAEAYALIANNDVLVSTPGDGPRAVR